MLKPHDTVKKVRVEISMYGKYLIPKHKFHTSKDNKNILKHIENPEYGYLSSSYVIRVGLTVTPEDKLYHLPQAIIVNRD